MLSLPIAYQTSNTFNEYAEITVLSFGGGQDSTCILYKIIYDPAFRARFVRGHLVVIMSDTGDEHRYTYDYSGHIKQV
ncbi:hypothetical protein GXP67_31115 [Rhodocytophaga rosea]|uniref:Uncharacterized protein n=1 Tax=Rhodocytophaga rosea TaxID=2704465 RepID=A0A6C0GTC5_9BACT|nr:hypothetical protein [Rhodocytophaga rosea]QHT70783.1 hypothetical protein GXP67_31115 [Rhodocytophaga rosea]